MLVKLTGWEGEYPRVQFFDIEPSLATALGEYVEKAVLAEEIALGITEAYLKTMLPSAAVDELEPRMRETLAAFYVLQRLADSEVVPALDWEYSER